MAKFAKLLGSARGRVGGLVFSKGDGGENYVRSYQPMVNNPKSTAQKSQRAKMNLVGRMSGVTPAIVLAGLQGENNRQRRSRFSSMLLKATITDLTNPSQIVAKVEPEDIVFSEGSCAVMSSVTTPVAVTANSVTLALTLSNSEVAGAYGEKIIVAVIDPSAKGGYSVVYSSDVIFESTAAKQVTIGFASAVADESMVCVYRVPFMLTDDGRAAISTSTIYNDGTEVLAQLLSGSAAVRIWGRSVLSASVVFTQA
jgi:hypothetical protein